MSVKVKRIDLTTTSGQAQLVNWAVDMTRRNHSITDSLVQQGLSEEEIELVHKALIVALSNQVFILRGH